MAKYRGHLDNISDNMLTGAINYFNGEANLVKNQLNKIYGPVPEVQRDYKRNNISTIVVGDENYGEGHPENMLLWSLDIWVLKLF